MQKVEIIIIILITSVGCSVNRKQQNSPGKISDERIIENIINNNITKESFYIQKAEIKVFNKEEIKYFFASIKFKYSDKYLISIKSKSGIEGARIFISEDSVFINDRINRKHYYGSSKSFENKYGITPYVLPILLGDYINENLYNSNEINCIEKNIYVNGTIKGIKLKYVLDCKKKKVIEVVYRDSKNNEEVKINFKDFIEKENFSIPGKIEVYDSKEGIKIEIKIKRIQYKWTEEIDFITGNRYEKIRIL